MSGRLAGRIAVVTGGGGGLGGAICTRFAEEGATVVVVDVNETAANQVATECKKSSSASTAMRCDVSESAEVETVFGHIRGRFGRVDVLAATAGISATSQQGTPSKMWDSPGAPLAISAANLSDENWRQMLAVHLDGTFFCIRAAIPLMTAGGSIVCMSSIAALNGLGPFHYAAAKGGILGLVRALARDLGPSGIRINAVSPGAIDAGMTLRHDRTFVESVIPSVPLRRLGDASDVAHAALYLASDESAYTTGQWMSPNGGLVIA